MPSSALLIRPSLEADLPAITAIYAHHVMHGTGSFEIDAPDLAEMTRRRADVLAKGLPHLVASRGAEVLGFAYAGAFRPRPAFRFMAEDSVYIHADHVGLGIGRALLAELLRHCEALGIRQMLAVIGDSANAGSMGLHHSLGFAHTGSLKASGWKHGRWLDTVFMQKTLGAGDSSPASELTPSNR
jgi:L-amino acid N-acyltransferase YncA